VNGRCEGAASVYFNAAFNLSLLALFIAFSRKTYTDAGNKPGAASQAKLKPS
jgi:hypothetical protein